MKKNNLVGSITDLQGNTWNVFADYLTFDKRMEDVVVEDITLEYQSGNVMMTLCRASLSEMPDRFSQAQVNALENHILEEHRIDKQAYQQDSYASQRRFE